MDHAPLMNRDLAKEIIDKGLADGTFTSSQNLQSFIQGWKLDTYPEFTRLVKRLAEVRHFHIYSQTGAAH